MSQDSYITLIASQAKALYDSAVGVLGPNHAVTFTLKQVVDATGQPTSSSPVSLAAVGTDQHALTGPSVSETEADVEMVRVELPDDLEVTVANGVSPVEVTEAVAAVRASAPDIEVPRDALEVDENTGEVHLANLEVFAEVNGVTIGDEEVFDRYNELAEEAGFEDGTPEIEIVYRRLDGEEFTGDQLEAVLNHQVSQSGLARLGARTMYSDEQSTGDHSSRVTRWFVAGGSVSLAALRSQCAMYQGTFPFPGVGSVSAKATPVG